MLCATCKYAAWEWTKHKVPKINKKQPGFCKYRMNEEQLINMLVIPKCVGVNKRNFYKELLNMINNTSTLWTNYDIENCFYYEEKE